MAAFPKYYVFDPKLLGDVRVVFDEHPMHMRNFREHLECFPPCGDEEFTVMGDVDGDVVTYCNGDPKRMRDGVIWILTQDTRAAFTEWVRNIKWPSDEKFEEGIRLPGRWLTPEEGAKYWLSFQHVVDARGELVDVHSLTAKQIEIQLKKRSVQLRRFERPSKRTRLP